MTACASFLTVSGQLQRNLRTALARPGYLRLLRVGLCVHVYCDAKVAYLAWCRPRG